MAMKPNLAPISLPNQRQPAPPAMHTSADMLDSARSSPGRDGGAQDEQPVEPPLEVDLAGEAAIDLGPLLQQEPAAGGEARWIVQVEVCAAGSAEPRERRAFVSPERVTFGRSDSCDIHFGAEERIVSSLHAELLRADSGYILRDTGSRNGTYALGLNQPSDPSQGPGSASAGEPAEAPPRRLTELPLEVSAQPTEILLGPQGPVCRIRIGDVIPFADYLVTGRLGEGGMATVFVAQETTGLSRLVVLKLIAPSLLMSIDQKEAEAMLQEEARIASQISHPNVVNIFRAGCYHGSHYIAMEYLRGVNLGSIQRQLARRRSRCPADLAAALLSQALLGLHAAHEAKDAGGRSLGIVHRDFTPTNIVCSPDGDVKLIDFGVARAIGRCYRSTTGQFVGKPAYASPEQIQRPKTLDRRSDVFAAGIILYELCVGKPLFLRDHDFATLAAVISEPLPPLTGVPETLVQILNSALSREPEGRPPTAAALAEQLERFVLSEGGRYLQRKNIAQTLRGLGVNLTAPTPRTLVGRPTLFPKPRNPPRPSRVPRPPRSALAGAPIPCDAAPESQLADRAADRPLAASPDNPPESPAGASAAHPADDPTKRERLASIQLPEPLLLGGTAYRTTLCLQHADASSQLAQAIYVAVPAEPPSAYYDGGPTQLSRLHRLHLIGGEQLRGPLAEPYRGRLQSLIDRWREAGPRSPFGPLLAAEPAWPEGPLALLLANQPAEVCLRGLLLRPPLPWPTRSALAQKLALALAQAISLRPGLVHGELTPAQVMVLAESDQELRLWLRLPTRLAGLLGEEARLPAALPLADGQSAGPPARPELTEEESRYCAPECLRGAPQSQSSDVFSIAAIIFELLGGDLLQASQAIHLGCRLPLLPPSAQISAAIREGLGAALGPDPSRRPIVGELARCLGAAPQQPAVPAPRRTLELELPPPGSASCTELAAGGRLHLYTLLFDRLVNRGPQPLPLNRVSGLLPAPVSVSLYRDALAIELVPGGDAALARLRLYPEGSEVGKARLFLDGDGSVFELGSRTQNLLQRIEYQAMSAGCRDTAELPALALRLRLGRRCRAALLWTRDLRSGDLHVCCAQLAE